MKNVWTKHFSAFIVIMLIASSILLLVATKKANAGSYDGADLAYAILADPSTLISSQYTDTDHYGHRQEAVLSSLGIMYPTNGSTFALLSTGMAGTSIITTNAHDPGDERGTWFGKSHPKPWETFDEATLTLTLQVPPYMHYLYYDVQFFTAEYPDYVGTQYNDELKVTVNSPSHGTSEYIINVNSGDFVLNSNDIPDTGFDIFATSGYPGGVDWVTRTPGPGADAGATALVTRQHAVSPYEQVTITFDIKDRGDNLFDSGGFIDNVVFSGYAKTDIIARKTLQDLNGGLLECGDTVRYTITISNIGTADQSNNPGNEFEDFIPENTTYVSGSATATSGTINYESANNKITWDGGIPSESSVALSFDVTVNQGLFNGALVSNQGTVYWDSNEDGTNDATELTDDPAIDDGIDQDGDGATDDDDPTIGIVSAYEPPSILTEDFSDDAPGGKATESYEIYPWFETSEISGESNFEVASIYHYQTAKSFKTKLRASDSPQYWDYNLSGFNRDIAWWEIWFACGNTSDPYTLSLNFKNTGGSDIAKIKLEYEHEGTGPPTDYVLNIFYWSPVSGWDKINSDYLFNGWYKLKIEKNGSNFINYSVYSKDRDIYYNTTGPQLDSPFSNFARIEWVTTSEPTVCPLFFWDEHNIGLADI